MSEQQCRYLAAAYPTLDAEDTCWSHRHEPRVFALAEAMAHVMQTDVTDEKIGWFVDDANAIVDDFNPTPDAWEVTESQPPAWDEDLDEPTLPGISHTFTVNGRRYVVQDSDWEPASPVALDTYLSWIQEDA